MLDRLKKLGPGLLVTSAFIGPGTVTLCSIAGQKFGFALLWALLFSVLATMILQEMCARLGLVTQQGLGETIKSEIGPPLARSLMMILIFSAILVGNGAYEAGNISGAVLGVEALAPAFSFGLGSMTINGWHLILGLAAFMILMSGSFKIVQRMMAFLVFGMSTLFIITAIISAPAIGPLLKGIFIPSMPSMSTLTIIGLIGTTVVPYNLFLHASSISQKWKKPEDLPDVRRDAILSIFIGGLISMAIVISSAALFGSKNDISNAADLAVQLEPVLGSFAKYCIAIGLFTAGISSAVTAPLAASFAAAGIFGWSPDLNDKKFKTVSAVILIVGILFSSIGFKPITVIQFAQVANGILLPVIAIFLLWVTNRSSLLGKYKNTLVQNVLAIIVIGITILLAGKSLWSVFGA